MGGPGSGRRTWNCAPEQVGVNRLVRAGEEKTLGYRVKFWWSRETILEALRAYLEQAPHWQAQRAEFHWHEEGVDVTATIPDEAMAQHDAGEFESIQPVGS